MKVGEKYSKHTKPTFGLMDGKVVEILYDVRGEKYNPQWKTNAVLKYMRRKL